MSTGCRARAVFRPPVSVVPRLDAMLCEEGFEIVATVDDRAPDAHERRPAAVHPSLAEVRTRQPDISSRIGFPECVGSGE